VSSETDKQFIYNTYTALLKECDAKAGMSKTETYEEKVKAAFIKEPANMKLLIVVDKLLTGFDAPCCSYLYIDKSMQDHGLFQAICRTNRLDGEDKDVGCIVDYKDLFHKVENVISVYSSELDTSEGGASPDILLHERLEKGKERLDQALEAIFLLCEPVEPPHGELDYIHFFCGNSENAEDLSQNEHKRTALYKATVALVRAYANIADDLSAAGYDNLAIKRIKKQVEDYVKLRELIRNASGENLDLKAYEADMRHLLDRYIEAGESTVISPFGDLPLLELIIKTGMANAISQLPKALQGNQDAVAETIENNIRSTIIKTQLNDPAYFEKMSALLNEIIANRKAKAIEYNEYLKQIADLAKQVIAPEHNTHPDTLNTPAKRAIYNNVGENEALALAIDKKIKDVKPHGWRGVTSKENVIQQALYEILGDFAEVERIFNIITQQSEY
jgi:type I restriction enzyme R subunit